MKPFKINTGKTDDAEISKGKVPPIDDMEEGSDAEEADESPAEEKKEVEDGEAPDADDKGASGKGGVDKEQLKGAIKEVNMEKDLEYSVNNRSKEELQCLIKMAQAKLAANDFKDSSSKGASPSIAD